MKSSEIERRLLVSEGDLRHLQGEAQRLTSDISTVASQLGGLIVDLRGEGMTNLEKAVIELVKAVKIEGIRPDYHKAMVLELTHKWPSLWRAIDDVIKEAENINLKG